MHAELLVVGGGITGLSVAVHAARGGLDVVLVEAGELGGTRSTQRSGALLRTHYADAGSARLALEGLASFASFAARYGGPAGFTQTGFAYVPQPGEELEARVAMLRGVGVETELVTPAELARIDPAIHVADAPAVAYEPHSGYASPRTTCDTLARAARRAGAVLHDHRRVARLTARGALLADGEAVHAERTLLCAGTASADLGATVGLHVDVRPTAVKLVLVQRRVATHLAVIDAPNGTYLRPDGTDATLVGRRTWTDEPLPDAAAPLPEVDEAFATDARERLARRLPSSAGAPVRATRTGQLDMTPDGLPLVGPTAIDGLWLCCGWSGTGFKTGPAVGAALADWLIGGTAPAHLAGFDPARSRVPAASVRSPH